MIAIPNMEKPSCCGKCILQDGEMCFAIDDGLSLFSLEDLRDFCIKRRDDCPLIEIIQCKECKHSKVYALQSDAPMKRWCHRNHFPKEVTDGYYCGDGERK